MGLVVTSPMTDCNRTRPVLPSSGHGYKQSTKINNQFGSGYGQQRRKTGTGPDFQALDVELGGNGNLRVTLHCMAVGTLLLLIGKLLSVYMHRYNNLHKNMYLLD